jgi:hypothetical protein
MKRLMWKYCLMAACASSMMFGRTSAGLAANEDSGGPDDRFQRLERRINELAERQEQMMRRLGAGQPSPDQMPRFGPAPGSPQPMMPGPGPGGPEPMMNRFGPALDRQGPMPAIGPENMRLSMSPMGPGGLGVARALKGVGNLLGLLFLVGMACNILIAVWIFSDIRKRGEGSGIFIALSLLAGIPAAIIYSLVRIGDKK